MPVKLGSKLPESEARIEIIPLIDIMFFLLAAFMLVSLSMVNLKGIKVDLPTAASGTAEARNDFISLSVDRAGMIYFNQTPIGANELRLHLAAARQTNESTRVFISGDTEARHGDVVGLLDLVRSTGIQRVAFEIRPETAGKP